MPHLSPQHVRFHQQWWLLNREAASLAVEAPMLEQFGQVTALDKSWPGTPLAMRGYPWPRQTFMMDLTWTPSTSTREKSLPEIPELLSKLPHEVFMDLRAGPWFFARKFSSKSNIGNYQLHVAE